MSTPATQLCLRQLRIDAQLLKPVQQDELLETIFRVMSRATTEAPTAAREAASALATVPLHLLVAEDNEFNAELLEQLLVGAATACDWPTMVEKRSTSPKMWDSTYFCWTSTCRSWMASRSFRRFGSASGPPGAICRSSHSRRARGKKTASAAWRPAWTTSCPSPSARPTCGRRSTASWLFRTQGAAGNSPARARLVLWDVCGGDAGILEKITRVFRARLPDHLAAVQDALRDQDTLRLARRRTSCVG